MSVDYQDLSVSGGDSEPATATSVWTQAHLRAPYPIASIRTIYRRKEGVVLVPVADTPKPYGGGNATTCEVCQVAAPYGVKIVEWFFARIGEMPSAPDPAPSDPNLVLAKVTIVNNGPMTDSDGTTHIFVCSGRYVWIERSPRDTADGFPGTAPPFDSTPAASNTLGKASFDPGILGSGGQGNIKKLV